MKCTDYFSKTETNEFGTATNYRIYLYDVLGWPHLVRSALDYADNVHKELIDSINVKTDYFNGLLHNDELFGDLTIEQRDEVLSITAKRALVMQMENDGWTMHPASDEMGEW